MKKLLKKTYFVLFILSFFVFFFSVGKNEVSAQVENCTLETLGEVCDLGNGEEGVCAGVGNNYGGYSSFYCQGPEEEGLVEQCSEETEDKPCRINYNTVGVCKYRLAPGNPPEEKWVCIEESEADENCTLDTLGDVCDLGNGEEGVCAGVENNYGGYSSFYCQGPEEEGLVEQCSEETEDKPCRINYNTIGVCKYRLAPGNPPEEKWVCIEESEADDDDWEYEKTTPPPPTLGGDENGPSIADIVDTLLDYLFPIAGVIALIFIIMGGYMWIISAGDPSKVKQAQGTLTWAIIGLVVVMVIFSVLRILINFLS